MKNLKKEDLKKDIIGFKNGFKKDIIEFGNGFKCMFNDLKTKGRRHKQIANIITLSRLVLSCFIPPLALAGGIVNLGLASGFAVMALGTDFIDGMVARKTDSVSEFGKNLDPVCDKLAAAILLAPLMIKSTPLITLSLCMNLGLEAGIALVNLNSKAKGNVPRTTILGKVKTASLSALLVSSYLSFTVPMFATITPIVELITIGFQTGTLIDYKQIDKKKDAIREKIEIVEASIEEPTLKDEELNPEAKLEESTTYTIADYKALKEEVIRTGTPDEQVLKTENDKRKNLV